MTCCPPEVAMDLRRWLDTGLAAISRQMRRVSDHAVEISRWDVSSADLTTIRTVIGKERHEGRLTVGVRIGAGGAFCADGVSIWDIGSGLGRSRVARN